MPPARKKAKVTRAPDPAGPAPVRLSPPPTPPPEGNGEDEAELLVARERTIAAQTETAAAEAERQATIATIELTATRASAAKADSKVQREKAAQEANEADKRRAHELKIAMLQAGAGVNAPDDDEDDEFKQRRPDTQVRTSSSASNRRKPGSEKQTASNASASLTSRPTKQDSNWRQQPKPSSVPRERPSPARTRKQAEKIRKAAVIAERSLNAMQDAAAASQEANDTDDDQKRQMLHKEVITALTRASDEGKDELPARAIFQHVEDVVASIAVESKASTCCCSFCNVEGHSLQRCRAAPRAAVDANNQGPTPSWPSG